MTKLFVIESNTQNQQHLLFNIKRTTRYFGFAQNLFPEFLMPFTEKNDKSNAKTYQSSPLGKHTAVNLTDLSTFPASEYTMQQEWEAENETNWIGQQHFTKFIQPCFNFESHQIWV